MDYATEDEVTSASGISKNIEYKSVALSKRSESLNSLNGGKDSELADRRRLLWALLIA